MLELHPDLIPCIHYLLTFTVSDELLIPLVEYLYRASGPASKLKLGL